MNWQAGDIAICHCPNSDQGKVHGMTVTLIQYVGNHYIFPHAGKISSTDNAWCVDANDGRNITVNEKCLRKPYDGNELREWSDCIWQPETVTT